MDYAEPETNYYQNTGVDDSVRYRLDGTELIENAIDTFKGGVKHIRNGVKTYYTENALMNDLGIAKARMLLETGINKVNHLTKYSDEERVLKQVKAITGAWLYEVTLNMKKWAPKAYFDERGKLINPTLDKVRNKHLVVMAVENSILQSMLRGTAGFEAEITGKQIIVSENKDYSTHTRSDDMDSSNRWFGGLRR